MPLIYVGRSAKKKLNDTFVKPNQSIESTGGLWIFYDLNINVSTPKHSKSLPVVQTRYINTHRNTC